MVLAQQPVQSEPQHLQEKTLVQGPRRLRWMLHEQQLPLEQGKRRLMQGLPAHQQPCYQLATWASADPQGLVWATRRELGELVSMWHYRGLMRLQVGR
jgi:hypothetical protein